MPGPKQLREELKIKREDWRDLALACGIHPRKKILTDDEADRVRTAKNLLQQGEASTYEQIAAYFQQQQPKNGDFPSSTLDNMIRKIVEQGVNEGIVTGDLYGRVFQEAAKQRFREKVESGELQHNLSQGFHNILFENGLTAEQLESEGMRMIQQMSDDYEPQFLTGSGSSSTVKMISGNVSDEDSSAEPDTDSAEPDTDIEIV